MKAQRVRPDDDVINLVLVEQLDQISEVLLNFHGIDLGQEGERMIVMPLPSLSRQGKRCCTE
jgi:hypothetical protein